LLYSGRLQFEDKVIPAPSKDEWGIDTLTRIMHGPCYLLAAFLAGLAQRQTITTGPMSGKYPSFYLQSWHPTTGPYMAIVTMLYKGLATGQLPDTIHENTTAQITSTLNASNLSVAYGNGTVVSATREIKYAAPRTVYRFVTNAEPNDPVYSGVSGGTLQILESRVRVTYDDGTTETLTGSVPASIIGSLQGVAKPSITGPAAKPLVGTPYWQCETTVEMRLVDPS